MNTGLFPCLALVFNAFAAFQLQPQPQSDASPAPTTIPAPDAGGPDQGLVTQPQHLWADQRQEVLDSIGRTLQRRAFVVGVDFSTWPAKVADAAERLERAASPGELTREVNRLLATYGISHIKLKAPAEPSQLGKPPASRQPADSIPPLPLASTRSNQSLTWEPGEIAVLKIRSFDDDQYDRQKVEGLFDEIRPKATGLVLDLRSNGGGAVTAMTHLLGLFLKRDTAMGVYVNREIAAAYERSVGTPPLTAADAAARTERKFRVRRNARDPLTLPMAVLISPGSASASEIVAAALRDHANAALVGQPSAGKVLLSVHAKLPHGFELQFPTADYVTGKGVRLEGTPLRPHVLIPGGRRAQPRAAVDAAVEVLRHGL